MKLFEQIKSQYWLPLALAGLAGVLFLLVSFQLTHQMVVTMDEGSFLLKGNWLLDGGYRQFGENQPILNKMPLSFVTHGLSQVLFEPGIRSGRYFSILQGFLTLLALWLAARKISNAWWAATVAWLFVINQPWLMFYARPMSQVTTIMFLAWSLYFLLGEGKNLRHAMLGLVFACFVVLTRQNMATYLALAYFYVVWVYGFRESLKITLPAAIVFLLAHIWLWPEIYLDNWRALVPDVITNTFVSLGLLPAPVFSDGISTTRSSFTLVNILQVIFGGFYYSFIPVLFVWAVLAAYPYRKEFASDNFRQVVFLVSNFILLVALHIYGVVDHNLILYSFYGYMAFFAPMGLLLLPLATPVLGRRFSGLATAMLIPGLLALAAGAGLHLYREISGPILSMPVPRIRELRFESGSAELWRVMLNRFGWEYPTQEYIFTALAGLGAGLFLVTIAFGFWLLYRKKADISFGWLVMVIFFTASLFLTGLPWFSAEKVVFVCEQDTIVSFEQAGQVLAENVPAGSIVFWDTHTDPSPAILLYLKDFQIHPVLINGRFYHQEGVDVETALRANVWTDELGRQWMQEADYLLLNNKMVEYWQSELQSGSFELVVTTPPVYACFPNSMLNIYQNTGK